MALGMDDSMGEGTPEDMARDAARFVSQLP